MGNRECKSPISTNARDHTIDLAAIVRPAIGTRDPRSAMLESETEDHAFVERTSVPVGVHGVIVR